MQEPGGHRGRVAGHLGRRHHCNGEALPESTPGSHQGCHVINFGPLGPRAAGAAASLLYAVEDQGHFPAPHNRVQDCLQPKPTGGRRPFAAADSLAKAWATAKRGVAISTASLSYKRILCDEPMAQIQRAAA